MSWVEGLAQGFRFASGTEERDQERDLEMGDLVRVKRALACWL